MAQTLFKSTPNLKMVMLAAMVFLTASNTQGQDESGEIKKTSAINEPTWIDGFQVGRNLKDLTDIVSENSKWVESHHSQGHRAELSGADLTRVDLQGKDLREADLNRANLTGNSLGGVLLDGADLRNAKLTDAKMAGAVLRRSNLGNADMQGAWLYGADLDSAIFEPDKNPDIRGISGAIHLEKISYVTRPDAMTGLRKQLGDAGFREAERRVICAMNRAETDHLLLDAQSNWVNSTPRWMLSNGQKEQRDRIDSLLSNPSIPEERKAPYREYSLGVGLYDLTGYTFRTAFFDWPCAYGMLPGRPLRIAIFVWLICTFIYYLLLHLSKESAIFRIDTKEATDQSAETKTIVELKPPAGAWRKATMSRFFLREMSLLYSTAYFSLLNGLRLGFHDLDFGKWLGMLSKRPREMSSSGWARMIAGVQSLVTLYLVALWVLTYFGNPFD
jgi:hypothetical protein